MQNGAGDRGAEADHAENDIAEQDDQGRNRAHLPAQGLHQIVEKFDIAPHRQ
jgi:hypothetical protein